MPMIIPHGVSKQPVPAQRARWSYLSGAMPDMNPYASGTIEHLEWERNWFQESQDMEESVWAIIREKGRIGK